MDKLKEEGIGVAAASSDTLENTQKINDEWELNFPVGYGLDPAEISGRFGAFYEPSRNILHSTNFLLRPDNTIGVAVYSSGPLGRMAWQDVISLVQFYKSRASKPERQMEKGRPSHGTPLFHFTRKLRDRPQPSKRKGLAGGESPARLNRRPGGGTNRWPRPESWC